MYALRHTPEAPIAVMPSGALVQTYTPEQPNTDRPAVVVLGGIATGFPHLEPFCTELSSMGHTVHAYFPYTSLLHSPPLSVRDAANVVTSAGARDIPEISPTGAVLMGDSFGGLAARAIAAQTPQLSGLILANTGALEISDDEIAKMFDRSGSVHSLYGGDETRYTPTVLYLERLSKTLPYAFLFTIQQVLASYWLQYPPENQQQPSRNLQPTTVIRDSDDAFVPEHSTQALLRLLQESGNRASLLLTQHLGHLSLTTGPQSVADMVSTFASKSLPLPIAS